MNIQMSAEIGFRNGAGKEWLIIKTNDLAEPDQRCLCGREDGAAAVFLTRLRSVKPEFDNGPLVNS